MKYGCFKLLSFEVLHYYVLIENRMSSSWSVFYYPILGGIISSLEQLDYLTLMSK